MFCIRVVTIGYRVSVFPCRRYLISRAYDQTTCTRMTAYTSRQRMGARYGTDVPYVLFCSVLYMYVFTYVYIYTHDAFARILVYIHTYTYTHLYIPLSIHIYA